MFMFCRRVACLALLLLILVSHSQAADYDYAIKLKTELLLPEAKGRIDISASSVEQKHIFVQFDRPITPEMKTGLAQAGIEPQGYIPTFAFVARCDRLPDQATLDQLGVRWLGPISADQKISPDITELGFRDFSRKPGHRVQMVIVFHVDEEAQSWAERLVQDFDAEILGYNPVINSIDLILPENAYLAIAELDAVLWIEQALPEPVELNNNSRSYSGAETVQAAPISLTGAGVVVAEWDGGSANPNHPDLIGRVDRLDNSSVATHATHVAGTVLGSGAARGDLRYRGMAPGAHLLTQLWWGTSSELTSEYDQAINFYGARVATNSWGYGVDPVTTANCLNFLGTYFSISATIDNVVRGAVGPPVSIVWSAGNERGHSSDYCGSLGWEYGTIGTLAVSKNVITVGAVSAFSNDMTSFSSWGPTDDGRIKPDVCGPGASVTSCNSTTGYTVMSGTSMSAPAVAGVVALMTEAYNTDIGGPAPLASTVKGVLINSAVDMGRSGPDYEYGHGKVDAVAAVKKISSGEPSYVEASLSTGESHLYDLTVPGGAERLKVTLVWDDPGGTVNASAHLINDLDLYLIDPFSNQEFPWVLNPSNPSSAASKGIDGINNVETVEIPNPVPGLWKAKVTGSNIPDGPQSYSLIFTPDSIHTPGNVAAVAVYSGGAITLNPGLSTPISFWVSNVGANLDSFTVSVTDNAGWLDEPVDTVVHLAPYDSAFIGSSASVPLGALYGQESVIACTATSMTDGFADGIGRTTLVTAQTFDAAVILDVVEDTVTSPGSYAFDVTIDNLGNAGDFMIVTPSTEDGWIFSPTKVQRFVAYSGSEQMSFTTFVPAGIEHNSPTIVTVTAATSELSEFSSALTLIANNPFQPPALDLPASPSYMTDGTPLFEWIGTGDTYTLFVATDSLLENVIHAYQGIAETTFDLPSVDSLSDGIYYWAVTKHVGSDSSSTQRYPHKLYIDNQAPGLLKTSTPTHLGYKDDVNVRFYWVKAPGSTPPVVAPEYMVLKYSDDPDLENNLTEIPLTGFSYNATTPLTPGRWYWTVEHVDSAGNVMVSPSASVFVLDITAPSIPTLLVPEDSGSVQADSILFTWSAETPPAWPSAPVYYYVHISANGSFGDYGTFANFVYNDTVKVDSSAFDLWGTYWWRVKAFDSAGHFSDFSAVHQFTYGVGLCGDLNNDTKVNLSDITSIISLVYLHGPDPSSLMLANVNCDNKINLADITRLIDFVYISRAPMCCSPL